MYDGVSVGEPGDLPMRTAADQRHDDIRGHCFTFLIPSDSPPAHAYTLQPSPVYCGTSITTSIPRDT